MRPRQGQANELPASETTDRARPSIRWSWWLIAMLVLLAWNLSSLVPSGGPESLDYSAFRTELTAGNVATVDINGQTITGTLRHGSSGTAGASTSGPPATSTPLASPSPASVGGAGSAFRTVMPPFGDPSLLPAMIAQGVAVTAEDTTSGPGILPDLLIGLLPLVLLVGFGIWSARQFQRAGSGILGFGGSKARVYAEERPKVTFADVAGEDDAKAELREIVDYLRDRTAFDRVGARLPRGVLLVGPPGTGKTLLARAVAGEARVPFFSISGSEFVEMFVGVGASRVRDLFAKAKADGPAIVFMDEIDAVGRQRSTGPLSNDEREQTLNQLLVEMDGFDDQTQIVVLAATNRPDVLDPALQRPGRFDRQITVGYPDREGREAILQIHTQGIHLSPSVDLAEVARQTPGFSGADLANLANEAALQAARVDREAVESVDFSTATDRITLGSRHPSLRDPDERRLVAYHEGGHAVVATLTPGADPVDKVTIVPHGRALGATRQLPEEDRHNYPRDLLAGRLAVLLGGRAAEELVFGQPTTGAERDLREATRIARQMVGAWGMSDALGPVSFMMDDSAGANPLHPEYADATATRIDEGVRSLLEEARQSATSVLTANRTALDALAVELLAHEVVDRDKLMDLVRGQAAPDRQPRSGIRPPRDVRHKVQARRISGTMSAPSQSPSPFRSAASPEPRP
jgi:cell division protease FtsH